MGISCIEDHGPERWSGYVYTYDVFVSCIPGFRGIPIESQGR